MTRILVVGGDGMLGRAISNHQSRHGQVMRTTRRTDGDGMFLDLTQPWTGDPTEVCDVLVIASAVTSRALCEADQQTAAKVNTVAPIRLAAPLLGRGGFVLFLSTHIVLGGDAPFLATDAPYAPCDAYSRQKAEAEHALRALPGAASGLAILRLTKVLDASAGIVADWRAAIASGQSIWAFTDLLMAPVSVPHVVRKAEEVIAERRPGIVQLSGASEISFADFATQLGRRVGWDPALIARAAGRPTNPIAAASPPHASLACESPIPTDDVIQALATQIGAQ